MRGKSVFSAELKISKGKEKQVNENYRILRGFGRQMSRANVNAYAASTAFFLFLSLIPMLMLICSILPYTPIKKSDIITAVTLLPQTLSPLLTSLIQSIYDSTFGVMSIAAIVTVWSAGKVCWR